MTSNVAAQQTEQKYDSKAATAAMLSQWWGRPDPVMLDEWRRPDYIRQAKHIWAAVGLPSSQVQRLLTSLSIDPVVLEREYEELFVGPGRIDCPPYEAFWRLDRPQLEIGTVMGKITQEVQELYGKLGLQMKQNSPELPDHIAIEWEALAYAWSVDGYAYWGDALLNKHLACWINPFCNAVIRYAKTDFYQSLAGITAQCVSRLAAQEECNDKILS